MMDNLVYAPPAAQLDTAKTVEASQAFYIVGKTKFACLFFLTLGIYQFYWYYKNWSNYKQYCMWESGPDDDIWPFPRALFTIFFVHRLLYRVSEFAESKMRNISFSVDSIATPIVLLIILMNVMDRLAAKSIGSPYTDIIGLLVLVPLFYFTNIARKFINEACGDGEGKSNEDFTWANWVWMMLGAIFWTLVAVGLFLPEPVGE